MADTTRRTTSSVKEELLANPARFSFFQAVVLLRYFFHKESAPPDEVTFLYDNLRVKPHLSLSFPGSDMTELSEDLSGPLPVYHITATFMGLYGSSSPLPTFYTEDLIEEDSEDITVTRDFLDVVNSPFYPLLIRAVGKYRLFYQLLDAENPEIIERIFCLLGYGHKELKDRIPRVDRLPRYIGLFSQWPRSAMGLRTLISDALGGAPVRIEPNVPRMVRIPDDQRLVLGAQAATLGEDAHLGCEIKDLMGKITMTIGPLDDETYHACLAGQDNFLWVEELITLYLSEPVECRLEVELTRYEAQPARLGEGKWGALGHDAWVFSGSPPQSCRAFFELKPSEMRHDSCRP